MSDTLTRIPEGARVLYIGGGEEHQPDLIGRFGTVERDDKTIALPYYVDFDSGTYPRWWCPREALIHVPRIGDKIIPVNGELVGIPAEYRNAVGTVTGVFAADGNTRARIVAEYRSYQKPDDTIEWSTYGWKPADSEEPITFDTRHRMIGKFIRVRYSGSDLVKEGEVHKVTGVWDYRESAYDPKVDGITVQVLVGAEPVYVQAYEVVEDGETLTVSEPYRPAVGDRVQMTGYLSRDGIKDGITAHGTVAAVDGDIWTIDTALLGTQVSGPGYVFPVLDTDIVEPEPVNASEVIVNLTGEIDTLKRELERANERVEEYAVRAGKWERDFDRYANRIMQEAVDRGWCSQYEEVVDDIRGDLEIAIIPDREVEVDISWEETYTVTVRRSGTATLRAGYDESDIEEAARRLNSDDDADSSDILDAVRNGNYEAESYVDDSAQED